MKDNIIFNKTTEWNLEKEFNLMLRYSMELERIHHEEKLSRKARQILVVKKLNQRLCKNARFLRQGYARIAIEKGTGTSSKAGDIYEVFMVLKQRRLEFYR